MTTMKLLLLSPGMPADQIPARVRKIRDAFEAWRPSQRKEVQALQLNLGYSSCEGTEDIARTLEIASLMMHPDRD